MAKRVNKKFLLVLTTVVLIGGVTAMAAMYVLPRVFKKSTSEYVAESKRLEDEGKLDEAILQFQSAVMTSPKDVSLRMDFAELFNRNVLKDRQNIARVRQLWEDALVIDSRHMPALEKLLDFHWKAMNMSPRADTFGEMRKIAARTLAVDPNHAKAAARLNIAIIRQAQAGVPTSRAEIDKSIKALRELAQKNPSDADLPLYAITGELHLATEAAKSVTDRADAKDMLAAAEKAIDEMTANKTDADRQYRVGQLYLMMAPLDAALNPNAAAATQKAPTTAPAQMYAGRLTPRITAALAAAAENVKTDNPEYVDIKSAHIEWLSKTGQPEQALKLAEELLASHGEHVTARLAYVRIARRDENQREKILELLAKDAKTDGLVGFDAIEQTELQLRLMLERSAIWLTYAESEKDVARRKQLLDRAKADVDKLQTQANTQSPQFMELKGHLLLIQGQVADAVGLLQQASDRRGEGEWNVDSLQRLSQAYLALGQTGQAEKVLRQILTRYPQATGVRARWILTLQGDGRIEDARDALAEFKTRHPNAPELPALEATIAGGDKREAFVEKMPEGTPAERVRKAIGLRESGKVDEAIALAQSALKEDPKYMPAVEALVQMHLVGDRREEAIAVVRDALAANPENASLKQMSEQLVQRTPAELEEWLLGQLRQQPDAFARELGLYEFYARKANVALKAKDTAEQKRLMTEAETHLTAAEKLKPDDAGVLSRRFEFLVHQGRIDEANGMLPKLSAKNADGYSGELLKFRLAIARNNPDAATNAAREMTRTRPQFAAGWQSLGLAMQAQGRYREAATAYTSAIERQGRNYDALKGLIDVQYALNDPAAAKSAIDRARVLFPADPYFREVALNHELRHGDPAVALKERESFYSQNPDNMTALTALAETYQQIINAMSDPATSKALLTKMRKALDDGIKKWPEDQRVNWYLAQIMLAQDDFLGGEKLLKDFAASGKAKDPAAGDLTLSEFYKRANKPAQAEQSLRDALAKSSNSEVARQKYAEFLGQVGRFEEGVKQLEGIAGPGAARQRVMMILATGDLAKAEQAIRDAVAANPAAPELVTQQIEILIQAGKLAEAEAIAQQRLAKSDSDDEARYYLSLIKMRKQPADLAGAIKDLTDLSNRNPRVLNVQSLLAEARAQSNDLPGAIDAMSRALQLAPDNRDIRIRLIGWAQASGRWDLVMQLANDALKIPQIAGEPTWAHAQSRALAAAGRTDEAEKAITRAIAMVPPEQAGELERERLAILVQGSKFARAIELANGLIAKGRKEWWIYQQRGLAKNGLKDKSAIQDFDAALATLDPKEQYPAADAMIRSVYAVAGIEAALSRIEKWESIDPRWRILAAELCLANNDNAGALAHLAPLESTADQLTADVRMALYANLARAYHTLQPRPDYAKAVEAYKKYLQISPNDITMLNNVAYLLAEEISPARPAEALEFSRKAYQQARDWPAGEAKGRILDTHAWVLVLNGDRQIEEGIRILQEVVDESPILEAHYHLGEAELRQKRGDEAERQLTLASEMIEAAKKNKLAYDESLEPRIQRALERAKALTAAAAK